jgi:hypothetical protein
MDFAMELDMNPRKRFLEEDLALDGALHIAKKTRQAADAFAPTHDFESLPSTPSEAPSTPALTNADSEMQNSQPDRTPSPTPSNAGSLNQSRRFQRYLRQGYPMSWLLQNLN